LRPSQDSADSTERPVVGSGEDGEVFAGVIMGLFFGAFVGMRCVSLFADLVAWVGEILTPEGVSYSFSKESALIWPPSSTRPVTRMARVS
jgi:hypothetical protein